MRSENPGQTNKERLLYLKILYHIVSTVRNLVMTPFSKLHPDYNFGKTLALQRISFLMELNIVMHFPVEEKCVGENYFSVRVPNLFIVKLDLRRDSFC